MSGRLLIRSGRLAGIDIALADGARIGSAADADVRVDAPGILPLHASLAKAGERMELVDESGGASGGTHLNGRPVGRELLQHLDVITIGGSVDLIFLSV